MRRFGGFRQKAAGASLDRGRATHGAKWCFITPAGDMLNYRELREGCPDEAAWKAWRKEHETWSLFKSQKEAKRWLVLLQLLKSGYVRGLLRQVRMPLKVTRPDGLAEIVGHYVADHVYEEQIVPKPDDAEATWSPVIEEVKGYKEDLYIWKKRHFEIQYGVSIREV